MSITPVKTFILGVGAQKSGTTWLHAYLQSKRNVDLGFTKEYHIWDAVRIAECREFLVPLRSALGDRLPRRRWMMQNVKRCYFSYFASLLHAPDIHITGDITPSYSALRRDVFQTIGANFRRRGIAVKAVFLMRDPVDRCVSALSMQRRQGALPAKADYTEDVLAAAKSRSFEIRTRYDNTICELERSFASEQIYLGIYEEMFDQRNIDALSMFLNVGPDHAFAKHRLNESSPIPYDHSANREIARHYRCVYEAVQQRFPQTRQLWGNSRHVLH